MSYEAFISPVAELFGQGANDGTLAGRRRDADGNIKQTLADKIFGRTQDELNSAAHTRLRNSELGRQYEILTGEKVGEDVTSTQLGKKYKTAKEVDEATKQYLVLENNDGKGALAGLESTDIYKKITELKRSNQNKRDREPGGRIERMETGDKRYAADVKRAELAAERANNLATSQLALSTMQANNQMQIAQMNNQLQMRREDAKEARLERKDRQAAIQQMMAGLAQMGASIAI